MLHQPQHEWPPGKAGLPPFYPLSLTSSPFGAETTRQEFFIKQCLGTGTPRGQRECEVTAGGRPAPGDMSGLCPHSQNLRRTHTHTHILAFDYAFVLFCYDHTKDCIIYKEKNYFL